MNKKNRIRGDGFKEIKEILHRVALRLDKTAIDIVQLQAGQRITSEQIAQLQVGQRKTDEQIDKLQESQRKTDEQIRATEKLVEKTNKQIGELTDGWGKLVANLVAPSIPRVFLRFGIKISQIYQRVLSHLDGQDMEVDILCEGKRERRRIVLVIEVKSSVGIKDVRHQLEVLRQFSRFFPRYKGGDLVGAIGGITFPRQVREFAQKAGLFVLVPSGNTMEILNPKDFKPQIWH